MEFDTKLAVISYLSHLIPKFHFKAGVLRSNVSLLVSRSNLFDLFFFLFYHFQFSFKSIVDMCGVDYVSSYYRFQVIYNLLSVHWNLRMFVKVNVSEVMPLPSISSIYFGSIWLEREVFDFFGIFFVNHPDLRRILNDYGFSGYPLRKDFPLSGFFEVRYDDRFKKLISSPVMLPQEFRFYEFRNSWFHFLPSN